MYEVENVYTIRTGECVRRQIRIFCSPCLKEQGFRDTDAIRSWKRGVSHLAELHNEAHCHEDRFQLMTEYVCRVTKCPVTTAELAKLWKGQ